jgi:hypothetical protein
MTEPNWLARYNEGADKRDEVLRRADVRIPSRRLEDDPLPRRPAIMLRAHRRYGLFWAKRCEDVEDDLLRAPSGCVPAFCGLITPWFAAGVVRSVPDPCLRPGWGR